MSLLEMSDVHTYYGQSHILEGVSLDVADDEVVALLGRNGVGKTTTMRTILQLTPPREGSVRFDSEEMVGRRTSDVAKRGVGWIPEDRRVFSKLSVEENIHTAVSSDREIEAALATAFETFPILGERRDQEAGTLSGGQQQMLAIARGLVGDNRLLLIDEPSEGLAPQIVADVGKALAQLADEVAVLLVEQNLRLALDLADRFYVLDHGQIVDEGQTADVTPDSERLTRHLSA